MLQALGNTIRKCGYFGIGVVLLALAACSDLAKLPVEAGYGSQPTLPPPNKSLIPTVNIATAKGWNVGDKPAAAMATNVVAFAAGLKHSR